MALARHPHTLPKIKAKAFFSIEGGCHAYSVQPRNHLALGNRLVRTRVPCGVGAGRENPPATRLAGALAMFRVA